MNQATLSIPAVNIVKNINLYNFIIKKIKLDTKEGINKKGPVEKGCIEQNLLLSLRKTK